MKINDAGLDLIKSFESLKLDAYQDSVGVWTIGYGHIRGVRKGQRITEDQAEDFLEQDLAMIESQVDALLKTKLSDNQYAAVVSFTFNLGAGNLKSSTLIKKLNAGQFDACPAEFLKWDKAGGKVLKGLTRRRQAEAALFQS